MDILLLLKELINYAKLGKHVSILILMDILLLPWLKASEANCITSFNPYFNGYTTFTTFLKSWIRYILSMVSILILMDILLLLRGRNVLRSLKVGFNPYFNGYTTFTIANITTQSLTQKGFNPYFNGYTTFTFLFWS